MLSLLCKKLGKFLYEKGMRKVICFTYTQLYALFFFFLKMYSGIFLYYNCSHAVLDIVLRERKRRSSLAELSRRGNHRGDIQKKGYSLSTHLNVRYPTPFGNQWRERAPHPTSDMYLRSLYSREVPITLYNQQRER